MKENETSFPADWCPGPASLKAEENRGPLGLSPQAGPSGRQGPSEDPLWAFRAFLPVVRTGPQEAGSLQGHSLQDLMSNAQKNGGGSKE